VFDIVVSESCGEVPRRRSEWESGGAGRLLGELVEEIDGVAGDWDGRTVDLDGVAGFEGT
jgi:hypothetical protein